MRWFPDSKPTETATQPLHRSSSQRSADQYFSRRISAPQRMSSRSSTARSAKRRMVAGASTSTEKYWSASSTRKARG